MRRSQCPKEPLPGLDVSVGEDDRDDAVGLDNARHLAERTLEPPLELFVRRCTPVTSCRLGSR